MRTLFVRLVMMGPLMAAGAAVVFTILSASVTAAADTAPAWPPACRSTNNAVDGRIVQLFAHGAQESWGYGTAPLPGGGGSFYLVNPKRTARNAPLVVILHSANQNATIWLDYGIMKPIAPEDAENATYIPEGYYGLLLNTSNDEWWGASAVKKSGKAQTPAEKRVFDTIEWVVTQYQIDRNRIYLTGMSMGGCGSLGMGVARGDIFAAIKVFAPAGTEYMAKRMGLGDAGMKWPDPPVIVDLSAPNDGYSNDQGVLLDAARKYRIPLILGWGPFGHSGSPAAIGKHAGCPAVLAFPWLTIRKNEAYPVFTDASSDQHAPWLKSDQPVDGAGQINGYFRWKNVEDAATTFAMNVWLEPSAITNAPAAGPTESVTDVTFRRLQNFKIPSGQTCSWQLVRDDKTVASGILTPDDAGLLTIRKAIITVVPANIRLTVGPKVR